MSSGGSSDELAGFAGLLALGYSPEQAWHLIRDATVSDPHARGILEELARTPEGRETLQWSRVAWAERGLTPPWAELLGEKP